MFVQTKKLYPFNVGKTFPLIGKDLLFSNVRKMIANSLPRWLALGLYFFTPEDSNVTVYCEPVSRYLKPIPAWAQSAKTGLWIGLALLLAGLLAQFV